MLDLCVTNLLEIVYDFSADWPITQWNKGLYGASVELVFDLMQLMN